jgi:hypothetical protein
MRDFMFVGFLFSIAVSAFAAGGIESFSANGRE